MPPFTVWWDEAGSPVDPQTAAQREALRAAGEELRRQQADLARMSGQFFWFPEQYAQEFEQRREADRTARDRARQLLLGYLNDEQRREFEKTDQFVVYGSMTGTHYRLTTDRSFGIHVLVLDKRVGKLCATPRDMVPSYDQMLAQKLLIETDEPRFLKLANGY